MKIKVEPFTNLEDNEYYCIKYKYNGIFRFWQTLNEASLFNRVSLCTVHQPVLFRNFEKAVEYAKTLNKEEIRKHNRREWCKYRNHTDMLKSKVENKHFTFSVDD